MIKVDYDSKEEFIKDMKIYASNIESKEDFDDIQAVLSSLCLAGTIELTDVDEIVNCFSETGKKYFDECDIPENDLENLKDKNKRR